MSEQKLYTVDPAGYHRLRPVFAELETIHLQLRAILEGASPGTVYADDSGDPATALAISGRSHYLAGVEKNRVFNVAVHALLPRDTYFVLFCDLTQWGHALEQIVEGTYAVRARSRYYELARLKTTAGDVTVPPGLSLERVDVRFLGRELEHLDELTDSIRDDWPSLEAFLAHGFGYALRDQDSVITWSLSDYVCEERCEMGIFTHPDYRRRGLGTLTAAATAATGLSRGLTCIGWHCWDNNVGSRGVADNVGFEQKATYEVFINHWPAMNVTDMSRDEFRAFAQRYENEFAVQPPASGFPHVVAAKAWALSGDRAGCFRHLHRAVDLGWLRSIEHLRRLWPELWHNPRLEEMEEWRGLVRRLGPG
jgi:RimJ/RimL family protein N-acetyltransferase